jgi:iron complex transport system substrate-binding protein
MPIKRIVSFLPSATELLYELQVQDIIYGVTHECTYPEDAKTKPRVINSVIDSEKLSSREIDMQVSQLLKDGKEIFILDKKKLRDADPDLIISQETCEVCAPHTNQVGKAIEILQKRPTHYSMNPHNMQEILESVNTIGKILEKETEARNITDSLQKRIDHVKRCTPVKKQKILAIEWIEPFFTAGHWVPEMIETAGGKNVISKTGEQSKRLDIDEIRSADPDIIILMPCGFDKIRTISEYSKTLKYNELWNSLKAVKNKNIFAVDANSFFSKPSIRTITGLEILAKIIQPENFLDLYVPDSAFAQIK